MVEKAESPARLRNARACEACRGSKSRCIYKPEREICQRCDESGTTCIVRAKARPMRSRAISRQTPSSSSNTCPQNSCKFILDLPAVPSRDVTQDIEELHAHHKNIFSCGEDVSNLPSSGGGSRTTPSAARPLIKQRKISLEEAEKLLTAYKDISSGFPFVHIPDIACVPYMSRTSPFLLLAVLTSAAKSDPNLHHQLDHEFRRVLSQKIVVEGKKNLDFLQGLLVYIAWYPIHSNPKHSQTFVYMNLAISLTFDLGLDNEFPNPTSFIPIDMQGLVEGTSFTKAAKDAYLGCYCLSSAVSMGFQKPNSIQYRNLMETRGAEGLLGEDFGEIYHLVKLQRFWERFSEFHREPDATVIQSVSAEVIAQMFLKELADNRALMSEAVRNSVTVGMLDRFTQIAVYSYDLGFLRRPYHTTSSPTSEPHNISHEYKCLEATKIFFEYLLSLPEESFLAFTCIQWALVVHSILVLTRLTFAMANDLNWDSNTTRNNIPMAMYLDCLCFRFQKLSKTVPPVVDAAAAAGNNTQTPPQTFDPVFIFKMVLDSLKKSYLKRVAAIRCRQQTEMDTGKETERGGYVPATDASAETTPSSVTSRGLCPFRDPDLSAYFNSSGLSQSCSSGDAGGGGSPDEWSSGNEGGINGGGGGGNGIPIYFDIWSTMTGSWAKESPYPSFTR